MTAQQNNAKLHISVYSICCSKIKNGSPPISPTKGASPVVRTGEHGASRDCDPGRRQGVSRPTTRSEDGPETTASESDGY